MHNDHKSDFLDKLHSVGEIQLENIKEFGGWILSSHEVVAIVAWIQLFCSCTQRPLTTVPILNLILQYHCHHRETRSRYSANIFKCVQKKIFVTLKLHWGHSSSQETMIGCCSTVLISQLEDTAFRINSSREESPNWSMRCHRSEIRDICRMPHVKMLTELKRGKYWLTNMSDKVTVVFLKESTAHRKSLANSGMVQEIIHWRNNVEFGGESYTEINTEIIH